MKLAAATAAVAVTVALALAGCSSQSGDSNPDRQSDQLPVPTSTN
jgi:hypothetical protein